MIIFFWSGCSKNPDTDAPFLIVASEPAPFEAAGGHGVLEFDTNEPWRITPKPDENGQTGWSEISPLFGEAGKNTVKIGVNANKTYEERQLTLLLNSTSLSKQIVIRQHKNNAIVLGDTLKRAGRGGTSSNPTPTSASGANQRKHYPPVITE